MKFVYLLLTGLIGCSLITPEQTTVPRVQPMTVVGIDVLNKTDDSILFQTIVQMPTPCWHFKDVDISNDQDIIVIKPLYESDPDQICIQVIASDTISIPVMQLQPGSYRFMFWPLTESAIDTTITLP